MAFVLLLLLSLTSFTRIELDGSRQTLATLSARQNAFLNAQLALAQLQLLAGPDQRTTAYSGILDDVSADDGIPMPNPYWTGVWESSPEGPRLLNWLVSGNHTADSIQNPNFSPDAAMAIDSVRLFNSSPSNPSAIESVRVPLVKWGASGAPDAVGAYWIADEGVKARAASSRNQEDLIVSDNAALLSSRRSRLSAMDGLDWFTIPTSGAGQFINSQGALALNAVAAGADSQVLRDRFHDLTPFSLGVLADARQGGLRQDLTVSLFDTDNRPTDSVFAPVLSDTPTERDPGGPDWDQVRSWVRSSIGSDDRLPVRPVTDTQVGYFPTLALFQLYMLPSYDPNNGNQVKMHLMPAVVLWNPYDRALEIADYRVRLGRDIRPSMGKLVFSGLLDRFQIRLSEEGSAPNSNPVTSSAYAVAASEPFDFKIQSVDLAPGEARVYSISGGHSLTANDGSDPILLSPGFNPQWSAYMPLIDDVVLPDDSSGNSLTRYNYAISGTQVLRLELHRETVAGLELLQNIHYNLMLGSGPNTASMPPFPGSVPLDSSLRESNAVGIRYLHTWTDNLTGSSQPTAQRWLAALNPRAATSGTPGRTYAGRQGRNISYVGGFENRGDNQFIDLDLEGNPFVGFSEVISDVTRAVLFESSPGRERLHSIGQLMHAPMYRWAPAGVNFADDQERVIHRYRYTRYDDLAPAYAVGNSLAPPNLLTLNRFYSDDIPVVKFFDYETVRYDDSFLLNRELWDRYFFSAVTDSQSVGVIPHNPRMLAREANSFTANIDTSARDLLIDGAFNINSTSVQAWRAFYAAFLGEPVQRVSGMDSGDPALAPFLRTSIPHGNAGINAEAAAAAPSSYDGYRLLVSDELETLAEKTVEQIRLRGPFTSLSDFVNRSIDSSKPIEQRLRGTLAEAIRQAELNSAFEQFPAVPSGITTWNAEAESGWRSEHIPGWLSQADLLARLGNSISSRSDTFRIRAYGESHSNVGGPAASRAWCELIVQRLPEYVDSSDLAETDPASLSEVNASFGRRFAVLSFRWLSENEL